LAHTKEEAHLQAQLIVIIFQALGFSINTKKSLLTPQQEIEFLGVVIQSHPPTFHLPQHKLQVIKAKAIQLHKDATHQTITVREIAQFIGTTNAAAVAIPPAPLFYRSLQATKHHFQNQEGGTERPNTLVHHRQGRAKLVERTSQSMEFSQFATSSQLAQDNHRCIQLGIGGQFAKR